MRKGTYVIVAPPGTQRMRYGQVDVKNGNTVIVELTSGVYLSLPSHHVQILPNAEVSRAREIMTSLVQANATLLLALELATAAPNIVLINAATGLSGGAAIMNGLAVIGSSAMGGIVLLSSAPSALSALALAELCSAIENDGLTAEITEVAGVAGVIVSGVTTVAAVYTEGAVVGLSAAGITSGLAAIGGGAVASGGLGMVGGLVICCLSSICVAGGVTGAAWLVSHAVRQMQIRADYVRFLAQWRGNGYLLPGDPSQVRSTTSILFRIQLQLFLSDSFTGAVA